MLRNVKIIESNFLNDDHKVAQLVLISASAESNG